jgi:hypothetical protein
MAEFDFRQNTRVNLASTTAIGPKSGSKASRTSGSPIRQLIAPKTLYRKIGSPSAGSAIFRVRISQLGTMKRMPGLIIIGELENGLAVSRFS